MVSWIRLCVWNLLSCRSSFETQAGVQRQHLGQLFYGVDPATGSSLVDTFFECLGYFLTAI